MHDSIPKTQPFVENQPTIFYPFPAHPQWLKLGMYSQESKVSEEI
jgi:hypothetical protein